MLAVDAALQGGRPYAAAQLAAGPSNAEDSGLLAARLLALADTGSLPEVGMFRRFVQHAHLSHFSVCVMFVNMWVPPLPSAKVFPVLGCHQWLGMRTGRLAMPSPMPSRASFRRRATSWALTC